MQKEDIRLSVKQSILQAVIEYLQKKPYEEVADHIANLVRDAKPIVTEPPGEKKEKKE